MLQRQSNSLAARAATLDEQLSDKMALAEALQEDRSRLENELTEALVSRQDEARRGSLDGLNQGTAQDPAAEGTNGLTTPHTKDILATAAVAVPPSGVTAVAEAIEAEKSKADAAVAAAEAHSLALTEMTDSLVAEKVDWAEERAARNMEAMRLRARVRGLEEALLGRDARSGDEGGRGESQAALVEDLRRLLRERTRELEGKHVATERLGEGLGR